MKNGLTIGFEFLEDFYYSFVEVKETDRGTEYEIMLLDNRLTKLNQEHVVRERDGVLQIQIPENDTMATLKRKMAESLSQFLRKPILASSEPQS